MQPLKLVTLTALAVAAGIAAGDRPITISGGSPLRFAHVDWNLQDDDQTILSPFTGNVTSITVTSGSGAPKTIAFNGEPCELSLTFGAIAVTVTANDGAHGFRIKIGGAYFSKHFGRPAQGTFESNDASSSIQKVRIVKDGAAQSIAVSGHTEIVIHYE